jgi:hypothetical protein
MRRPAAAAIELLSVSCPSTGKNNDCGILVLEQFIRAHSRWDDHVSYDIILSYIKEQLAAFGLPYDPDQEQMGADSLEGALAHFLPNVQVELYNIVSMPGQRIEASVKVLNPRGKEKAQYRLALKSSWDARRNTTGAGHFVLLNTGLATQDKILAALRNRDFEDTMIRISSCIQCTAQPVLLEEQNTQRKFCNVRCQTAFYKT